MRKFTTLFLFLIIALLANVVDVGAQTTYLLNQTFDNITTGVPNNWDNSDYDCSSSYRWQSDAGGYNGTRGMKFNTYSAYTSEYSTLKTPVLNLNQAYYLRFKYQNYNAGDLQVFISTDGGTTYATALTGLLTTASASEWAEAEVSLSAYTGQSNVRIVFKGISNYGYSYQYLDDVVVESAPTCKAPTGLTVSNLTTTSADINWGLTADGDTPGNFQMTVTDEGGATFFSGNVPGSSQYYSLTGLTANTTYSVSMRGDCSGTLGGYSKYATVTFTTACNAGTVPYFENFDNLTGVPACTYSENASIESSVKYGTSGKSLKLTTDPNSTAQIVFPILSHAANDIEMRFYVRSSVANFPYMVGIVTDASDPQGTFEPLFMDTVAAVGTWTEIRMNTSATATVANTVSMSILLGTGVSTTNFYIDDVTIHAIPSCVRPEQFRAFNPTSNSIDLSWTTSTATQHIIDVTDPQGTTTYLTATTNPYTVTGLQPNSQYQFRIRAICSGNDTSEYASATVAAKTLCVPLTTTMWSEGAEGTTGTDLPDCWTYGYFNRPASGALEHPFITQAITKHNGSRAFQLCDMTAGAISFLTSPGFPIDSANKYQVSIWVYRQSGTSSNGEGLHLYASNSPDNTTGAQDLGFINRCTGNAPVETDGTGWYQYSYVISKTGTVYIIIGGESQYGSSTSFDDIAIELAPTCTPSGDISMSPVSASNDVTLSWTAGAKGETSWTLVYSLMVGSTAVASDSLVVTSPNYTIGNLTAATNYTLKARVYAMCSATDFAAAKKFTGTFSTPCGSISSFPYYNDFESETAGTVATCWDNSASTTSTLSLNPSRVWGVYSYGGNQMIRMYNYYVQSGTAVINTPMIVLPAQPAELQFDYSNRANCGDIYVKIAVDSAVNFVDLTSFGTTAGTDQDNPGTFSHATVDLMQYAGQNVYLQFYAIANFGSGAMFIDNVLVRLQPSCRDLPAPTISDIQPTSAIVTIADTASTWEISYGPQGTAAGAGTVVTVNDTNAYTITGLTPNTTYDVFVRRNCGTEVGAWSIAPRTFIAECTAATATISDVDAYSLKVTANANEWELSYGLAGTPADAGTIVPVSGTNNYTVTGLTPATNYVVYVRHNCSGVYSDWSYAYTAKTTTVPDSIPFNTGFEDDTDNNRWTIENGSSTSNLFTFGSDAAAVASGSKALYIQTSNAYGYNNGSSTKTYAYRTIYFGTGIHNVSFRWKCTGGESSWDFGRVMLVPASEPLVGGTGASYSSTQFPNYTEAFDPAGDNKMNLAEGDANGWNTYNADIDMTGREGTYNFVVMWSNDGSAGTAQYPISIDNVSISQVTCPTPNVLASSTTSTGTTVNVVTQAATQWEIAVSTTPIDVFGTVTGDIYQQVSSAPAVLTGLTANTLYYYTARIICGAGDTSKWADPLTVRTACDAYSVPYNETFDDMGAMNCWTYFGNVQPTRNTTYKYAGSASMKVTDGSAVSPTLNVTTLAPYMLNGWAYSTTDSASFSIGVMVDPEDAGTYEALGNVTVGARNTWTEFTTYFTLLNDPDFADFYNAQHFVIVATSGVTIYVDNLYLGPTPTCPKPTEVLISNVLAHSFDMNWTENGTATSWYVKAVPATPGQATIDTVVNARPATITGLNAASSYAIKIAAICSAADTSLYTECGTIATACDIVNVPYSEDFEAMPLSAVPNCWDNSASTDPSVYCWGVISYNGNKMIRMSDHESYYNDNVIIETPIVALPAQPACNFRFDYSHTAEDASNLVVSISTDGGTNWSQLGSYPNIEQPVDYYGEVPGTFQTIETSLAQYAGSNVMFRFTVVGQYQYGGVFVDNVSVLQQRSCSDVTTVTSTNVGETFATVLINDTNATHTQWQYVYGPAGVDPSSATPVLTSSDTINLTGLTGSTTYEVYVRAYCDAVEQSNWKKVTFTTTATPAAFPYICHFTDPAENSMWQFLSNGGPNSFIVGTDANALSSGEAAALYISNDNSSYYYQYSYGTVAANSQAVAYRLFNFQASQYTLHFSWKCTGGENNWDYARFYLLPAASEPALPPTGSYNASSWPSNVIALDGGGPRSLVTPAWNDVDMTLDMTATPGSYYLVFNWVNDGSGGTSTYPLAVNDIEIFELTCLSPANLNVPAATITQTSAVVNYTEMNGGSTVRYWYNTTGNRTDTTNIATATGGSVNLTNLSPAMRYYVFFQSQCSATDVSPIASVQFVTSCGVISQFPFFESFEGSEFPPVCWTSTPGTEVAWAQMTGDATYVQTGSKSAYVYGDYYTIEDGILLATPQIHFDSLREYNLSFYMYRIQTSYSSDNITVYLSNSPTSVAGAINLGNVSIEGTSTGMTLISYDIPAFTTGDKYIIFSGDKTYQYTSMLYIDDVKVDMYPTCRDLSAAPTIEATTATTMTVSAPKGPNHQGIIFAYAPTTATSVADTIGSVYSTTGTAVITGLTNSTAYKVYARGVCSATDSTAWTAATIGSTMSTDCFDPQNIRFVGLVGSTTATITWGAAPLAVGYECELNGTITGVITSDTAYLTGLTPKANYTFRVRTLCSEDTTAWATIQFTTTPSPAPLPYICNFEDGDENNQWELIGNNQTNAYVIGSATSNGGASSLYVSNDGSANAYTTGSSSVSFATRFFQLQAGQYAYSYDWNCYGESGYDYGRLFLAPDNITLTPGTLPSGVGTSGVPSGSVALDGNNQMAGGSAWTNRTGTFVVSNDGNYLLVVTWSNDGSVGTQPPFAIDNIQLTMLACPQPTLSVIGTSITQNTADVTIFNPNTSDTVVYAVSFSTVDQAIYTDTLIGQDTIHLTGLSASSSYNVYAKVLCSATDESFWASASFRTLCGQSSLPYTESFETVATSYSSGLIESICWNDLGASGSYPNYFGFNAQSYYPERVTDGNRSLQLVSNSSPTAALYLIMPSFGDFDNCRLTYDIVSENTTGPGILYAGYMTDASSASSFVSVYTSPRITTSTHCTVDFANVPAGARLAFKYADAGSTNYWAWLDNIRVSQLVAGPTYADTICFNSPYTNYGFNVDAADIVVGDNQFTRLKNGSAGAPDTIITANVYQRAKIENVTYDTLCQGQPLVWGGVTIPNPVSRAYTQTGFVSVTGCDSTVTLYLTVVSTNHTVNDTICRGDAYNTYPFTGRNITNPGTYQAIVTSPYGCLDTTNLILFVVETQDTSYHSMCSGDSYQWHGTTYQNAGTYYWSGTGSHGCPRNEVLILSVTQNDSTFSTSFCKGGQVLVIDTVIKTAGTYTITRFNYLIGCNVTYHVTVTEDPIKTGTANDYACQGYPYSGYGLKYEYLTHDTTVTYLTKDYTGTCDSSVVAHIKYVATVTGITEEASIPADSSYIWHDQSYNKSGYYYDTIPSESTGCDSICVLKLTVGGVEPVGVENVEMLNISLIPNPVNAGQTAFVYGNFTNVRSVEVLNSFGQIIDTFVPDTYPIEVQGISASGIYYVRVVTEDEKVAVQKLIVR